MLQFLSSEVFRDAAHILSSEVRFLEMAHFLSSWVSRDAALTYFLLRFLKMLPLLSSEVSKDAALTFFWVF